MAKILITGSKGQLGRCLLDAAARFGVHHMVGYDIDRLDIVDPDAVFRTAKAEGAEVLLNCAAYTAVDQAEGDGERAWALNAGAVEGLAQVCRSLDMLLLHISTDYVFDGSGTVPYTEEDETHPVSVYGASKLAGEKHALAYDRSIVVRTSWLYSPYGHNFVASMLRLGAEREEIRVVDDQMGSPTYAPHMADALLCMLEQVGRSEQPGSLMGVYHFSNSGRCSWFEFAQKIREHAGFRARIRPIPSSEYPTPVKRPVFSVLDTGKITKVFGIKPPLWQEGLSDYFVSTDSFTDVSIY